MKILIAALSMFAVSIGVVSAGSTDYYVKRYKNIQWDSEGTPYLTTVSGPFGSYNDCQFEAQADAREDGFHHIFGCMRGR